MRKILGSKIVQVKGLMPPGDGISRETPTGRAVVRNIVWHKFSSLLTNLLLFSSILPILLYFLYGFSWDYVNGKILNSSVSCVVKKGGANDDEHGYFSTILQLLGRTTL